MYDVRAHRRKQYWNEPSMGTWEKLYLPEILRGLFITSRVFLRNMAKWMTGRTRCCCSPSRSSRR